MVKKKELIEAINILMERTLGDLQIGMYIDFDNYCIKFLDADKNVIKWFEISESEFELLYKVFMERKQNGNK